MSHYEPNFVSIEGGRGSERRIVAEGLIAALRSHGLTATGLGRFGRRRLAGGGTPPFWRADVVLLENFPDAAIPSIRLGRGAARRRRVAKPPIAWIETGDGGARAELAKRVRLAAGRLARHLANRRAATDPGPDSGEDTRRPVTSAR